VNKIQFTIYLTKGIIFLFLFFFLTNHKVNATWVKSPTSIFPILQTTWDRAGMTDPIVIKDINKYKMWYIGSNGSAWSGGYAESTDGVTNWTRIPTPPNPVVNTIGSWEKNITYTLVNKESENNYKMWLIVASSGWASGLNRLKMTYSWSTNETTWDRNENYFTGTLNKWDEGGIERGISIVKINNTYHLWYAGTDRRDLTQSQYWRIGYATSPDGINWTKQNNGNPVIEPTKSWELNNVSYPHVLYENGVFRMWYAASTGDLPTQFCYATSTDGINWNKEYENPVMTIGSTGSFDEFYINTPRVSHEPDGTYKMWYSGYGKYGNNDKRWSIGYATNTEDPKPLTKDPVIIVPGMFASWSKEALLEGKTDIVQWKPLSFIKEYDGMEKTLHNLGYANGKDMFIWSYDWRKPINTLVDAFDAYITDTVKPLNSNKKMYIIGHSLGGLVARAWGQKDNHKDDIKALVTVGTPNQGLIQPYELWEGGKIPTEDIALSVAGKLLIELNRRSLVTTREIIQRTFPVLKDLLPTSPYLKKENNEFIQKTNMSVWNDWLTTLNTNASSISSLFTILYGTGIQTPETYTVTPPSWLDKGLGNWIDGKPTTTNKNDGDNTVVTSRSILNSIPSSSLSKNHNELIASKEGIARILEKLGISATSSQIVEGQTTTFRPSLLFLMRSPATFTVNCNNQTPVPDIDGIVFIPNAQNGTCIVTLTGTGTGTYHLSVGQFSQNNEMWNEYTDTITPNSTKTYTIEFTKDNPKQNPLQNQTTEELLTMIDRMLNDMQSEANKTLLVKTHFDVTLALKAAKKNQLAQLKLHIDHLFTDCSMLRKINSNSMQVRDVTLSINDLFINAYQSMFENLKPPFTNNVINVLTKNNTALDILVVKQLNQIIKKGKTITKEAYLYSKIEEYRSLFSQTTDAQKARKYILLTQIDLLLREIK